MRLKYPNPPPNPSSQLLPFVVPADPASCKELKSRHPHLTSGTYNITVGGSTFAVVCDMDTDQGKMTQTFKSCNFLPMTYNITVGGSMDPPTVMLYVPDLRCG